MSALAGLEDIRDLYLPLTLVNVVVATFSGGIAVLTDRPWMGVVVLGGHLAAVAFMVVVGEIAERGSREPRLRSRRAWPFPVNIPADVGSDIPPTRRVIAVTAAVEGSVRFYCPRWDVTSLALALAALALPLSMQGAVFHRVLAGASVAVGAAASRSRFLQARRAAAYLAELVVGAPAATAQQLPVDLVLPPAACLMVRAGTTRSAAASSAPDAIP